MTTKDIPQPNGKIHYSEIPSAREAIAIINKIITPTSRPDMIIALLIQLSESSTQVIGKTRTFRFAQNSRVLLNVDTLAITIG